MKFFIIAIWVMCGLLNAGWVNAHFQRKYPSINAGNTISYFQNVAVPVIFGPFGLPGTFILGFYDKGWSLSFDCSRTTDRYDEKTRFSS